MAERPAQPTTPPAPRTATPARGTTGTTRSSNGVSEDTAVRSTDTRGTDTRSTPVVPPPAPQAAKPVKPSKSSKSSARSEKSESTDGTTTASRPKVTRRARLRLTRVDPWSVMKTAFLLSIALGVVTVVSVAMVWQVLGAAGVWDSINSTIQETIGGSDTAAFDVQDYVGTSRVMGFTMLVAAVDVVLLTAVATLGAFLYNMAAALLGGIEVTLAEDPS